MTLSTFIFIFLLLAAAMGTLGQLPSATSPRTTKAVTYFQHGDYDAALKLLDEEIHANPRNNYAFFLRGELYLLRRNFEAALPDIEAAIRLAPKSVGIEKAYNDRGVIFQFLGKNREALADFDKAISLNPKYGAPYNGRGVILEKMGRINDAEEAFDRAIEFDPFGPAGYIGRADIRFQKSQFNLALSDLNNSLRLYPDDPPNLIRRGYVYAFLGRWEVAIADLRNGYRLFLDPSRRYQGILDVTFRDLDEYIARNPSSANARAIRGFVGLLLKKDDEANADFERAFMLDNTLKGTLDELIQSVRLRRER